jgi:uncharacterized protein (TIGR00730 family)
MAPKRICVFCGSSSGWRPVYAEAAATLARHLAANNISVVYGGGNSGLMGVLANTMLELGGDIIGVIPRGLVAKEAAHPRVPDLRIVESMHERKALMARLADAFIALPGGYGTFEEFCEVLTWTQLGIQRKPCGLLNVNGYYDALLALFDHAMTEQFLKPAHRSLVISDTAPETLVARLFEYEMPVVDKWPDRRLDESPDESMDLEQT